MFSIQQLAQTYDISVYSQSMSTLTNETNSPIPKQIIWFFGQKKECLMSYLVASTREVYTGIMTPDNLLHILGPISFVPNNTLALEHLYHVTASIYSLFYPRHLMVATDVQKKVESDNQITRNQHMKLQHIDTFQKNHSYLDEERLFSYIRYPNPEALAKLLKKERAAYPTVLKNNTQKNDEYMTVSLITMATRASILGGVPSQIAFLQSDSYLKELSSIKISHDLLVFQEKVLLDFSVLTQKHQHQKEQNLYVVKTKQYIDKHLTETISLSHLADFLGIRSDYLSRLFKQHEGITLTDYITGKKIGLAKELLLHSNKKNADIAALLNFSSPSYFSTCFKRVTGMSPKEFKQYIINHRH